MMWFENPEYLIELIKIHLRIDFDDDDQYLLMLGHTALEYIRDAVDPPALRACGKQYRIQLLMLVIVTDMYEHRSMSWDVNSAITKVQYTVRSIINQLQAGEDDE